MTTVQFNVVTLIFPEMSSRENKVPDNVRTLFFLLTFLIWKVTN